MPTRLFVFLILIMRVCSFLEHCLYGRMGVEVVAEGTFAAVVAAFFQQGQKIAAELVDGMDVIRELVQVLSQQILQFVFAQVDACWRRFFAEGFAGFVSDQAGFDRAGVAPVNLGQLG